MKTRISILHIYLLKIMIQKKTDFNYTNANEAKQK